MNRLLLFFLLLYLFLSPYLYAGGKIVLSFGGYDHPMAKAAETMLREAYGSIGISVEMREFPPERFMMMGDKSLTDGLLFGGVSISEKFTNLEKIPVPLGYDEIVVFTTTATLRVKDWNSLRPYSIGVLLGMPEVQRHTADMRSDSAATPRQLFLKLDAGRTDIVVFPRLFGLKIIRELGLNSIRELPGTIDRLGLYHYLGKGNANIPAVTKALRAMEQSGRIREINSLMMSEIPH